jgi:hypothetical protein
VSAPAIRRLVALLRGPIVRRLVAVLTLAGALAGVAAAAAPAAGAASIAAARLTGTFAMTGTITKAVEVPGEYVGQPLVRTWRFTPGCASGPCARVTLSRSQGSGQPNLQVSLTRRSSSLYAGTGWFWAPLQCGSTQYPSGEAVYYDVSVRIAAVAVRGARTLATSVRGNYASTTRVNETPCVGLPGQGDAAHRDGRRTGA